PVLTGTRITVREAISGYGLGKGKFGKGRIDRLIERVRFMSRPMLLSLRNTFRRKGRLALTLSTLTVAGGIFMAVMSVRASLHLTLDDILAYYDYDVGVTMSRSYRTAVLDQALKVPGVVGVEYWSNYSGQRLLADDQESPNGFNILSLPAQTQVFKPKISSGRWLLPEDAPAVVVNTEFIKKQPDVKLGDEIRIKVAGKKTTLRVVGLAALMS